MNVMGVGKIRFLEIVTSLMIGSNIMYGGVLLNEFILPNTFLITLLFVVFAIIVANKIGKSLWSGLATVILFFSFLSISPKTLENLKSLE